jgi:hypothetical protein
MITINTDEMDEYERILRLYESVHHEWMNTVVWTYEAMVLRLQLRVLRVKLERVRQVALKSRQG